MIPRVPNIVLMAMALPLLLLSNGFCAVAEWVSPELFDGLDRQTEERNR